MSYRDRYPSYPFFKETLSYQEQLMQQISSCRDGFNSGDSVFVKNAVEALVQMVTPKMVDDQFKKILAQIDREWEEDYEQRMKEYKEEIKGANCPDVVPKPSRRPPISYYQRKFMACLALFERRKLLLKVSGDESL